MQIVTGDEKKLSTLTMVTKNQNENFFTFTDKYDIEQLYKSIQVATIEFRYAEQDILK